MSYNNIVRGITITCPLYSSLTRSHVGVKHGEIKNRNFDL